jgi:hypothetical protein
VEAVKARGGAGGGNPMGALGGIFSSPDVWAKLSMNPQTRGYLQQPDFVAMLQAVQANPSSLGQYMQVRCGPMHTAPCLSAAVLRVFLTMCRSRWRATLAGGRRLSSPQHPSPCFGAARSGDGRGAANTEVVGCCLGGNPRRTRA